MRSRLVAILRSLADRIDPRANDPWGWNPSGPFRATTPSSHESNPWGDVVTLPPDHRSAEHAGVADYILSRVGESYQVHSLELLTGSDGHTYRLRAGSDFSAKLKMLNNPVDLAATLSLRGISRADDGPTRDAYEQLRREHGYRPEELSFVARPERGAIDIVIAVPGSTKKRPATRRRA